LSADIVGRGMVILSDPQHSVVLQIEDLHRWKMTEALHFGLAE
jgi:hypothetical protein